MGQDQSTSGKLPSLLEGWKLDIPQFYPILRSTLNISGLKDPSDLYSKLEPKPLLTLCRRLQEHYHVTAEVVANEQSSIGTRIREIDYAIATLNNRVHDRTKNHAKCCAELRKISELNSGLKKVSGSLQQLVPSAEALNAVLPADLRLPPLDFTAVLSSPFKSSLHPNNNNSSTKTTTTGPTSAAAAAQQSNNDRNNISSTNDIFIPEVVEEQMVVDASSAAPASASPARKATEKTAVTKK